ncbi:MAG: NB-ARC domain-containing protein, partial [Candidatus Promineifilaceae bacterium]
MSQYIDPIHLRQVLTEHYDLGELHTLCFDLGIDYEEIGGSGKTEKVVELVAFAQRHNRLDDIAAYVRRTRPTVPLKMTDTLPPLPAAGVGSGASITLHVAGDYVHGDKVGGDKVMGDKHDHHHYRERPAYEPLPLPPQGELPAPGVIPPYSRMALGRNPHFVGREPELHELAARLLYASDGEAQAITTHGIGGMGKSQLAVEYAHRFGRFYHSVHWLNCAEPDSIPAEIAACGVKMAARPDDFARYPLAVQVSQTHNEWGGGRLILLIFDNCEDPNLLKQWRPQAGRCRILLTSRRAAWSSHLAQTIKLDTLTRPQSMALLRRLTGTDSPYYETIADEVGDLPLALQLAGNYLREYGYSESPQAYLEALRQHPLRHDSLRGRGSDGSPTDHALSLDTTIAMSADKLGGDGVDPLAKRLLT